MGYGLTGRRASERASSPEYLWSFYRTNKAECPTFPQRPQASSDRKQIDIGANLFVGNLDINVDETTLYNAFSNFGTLVQPAKIQRDEAGNSKGFGFVSFDSFEAADQAIESLNGQFLMNKAINVQYAFKKDTPGERHGTEAERLLAAQARKNGAIAMMGAPPPPTFLTGASGMVLPLQRVRRQG